MELIARFRIGYIYSMKGHTVVEDILPLGMEPVADTDIEFGEDEDSGEIVVRFVMVVMGENINTKAFPEDVKVGFTDGGIIVWREIERFDRDYFVMPEETLDEDRSLTYKREALSFFERFIEGKKDISLM